MTEIAREAQSLAAASSIQPFDFIECLEIIGRQIVVFAGVLSVAFWSILAEQLCKSGLQRRPLRKARQGAARTGCRPKEHEKGHESSRSCTPERLAD